MTQYRVLIKGNNYLINKDGKTKKYGFSQNMFIEADSSQKAKLIAIATIKLDKELGAITLNSESDPPQVWVDTSWELDVLDDISSIDTNRNYFREKWWQFWK